MKSIKDIEFVRVEKEVVEQRKNRASEIEAAFKRSLDVLSVGTPVGELYGDISVAAACRALVNPECYMPSSPPEKAEVETFKAAAQLVQDIRMANTAEYPRVAIAEYLRTFSLASAMEASNKISRAAAQKAALTQSNPVQPAADQPPQWITLSFFVTPTQALALRGFCGERNINYKMGG